MKKIAVFLISGSLLTGCASVDMASPQQEMLAKSFPTPPEGKAGLYLYRSDTVVGAGLKKDLWVDTKCVGESAKGVFFYQEVEGDKEHEIATESEFSANKMTAWLEAGKNYFFKQFIKVGVFVGGANLEQVNEERGKAEVAQLSMAQSGNCGSDQP